MRTIIAAFFLLISINISAQKEFVGSWQIYEFMEGTLTDSTVQNKDALDAAATVWDLTFKSDGAFFQRSNMNPTAHMDEMDGTWKTESGSRLTLMINWQGTVSPITFFYSFENDMLILERYGPSRRYMIKVTYKKAAS